MSYLLGIDLGSSSVKATVVHAKSCHAVGSAQSPATEMGMIAVNPGWAEQDPGMWWLHSVASIRAAIKQSGISGREIKTIGITYQMHGLVCLDEQLEPLRPSIIWCDSRAVEWGRRAFEAMGKDFCLKHYLNSPGNFTASKLKWVKENEPEVYEQIRWIMLPGDYIALRLTGEVTTTRSGLSEGVLWDFEKRGLADELIDYYELNASLLPPLVETFSRQGQLMEDAAQELGLTKGISVAYRAGDQPNNAFSLNVLNPGEVASTAGTSGVIYGVTDKNAFDIKSRVNTFVHVNDNSVNHMIRNGILLCINGTGILNSWLRGLLSRQGGGMSYEEMNELAATVPIGSDGISVLPFGNGAERMLEDKIMGCSLEGVDFNRHTTAHLCRASQEGIVFAMKYGFELMSGLGLEPKVIRAGHTNMFLSPVFCEMFANTMGARLELYDTHGAQGAAIGAGIGSGIYETFEEGFQNLRRLQVIEPDGGKIDQCYQSYSLWHQRLNQKP